MFLRELFEAPKTAVFAFGRMNPPTIGHAKLVDVIKNQEGDPFLFLTHTQKPKTDPLSFAEKVFFAQKSFTDITIGDNKVRTIIDAMQFLETKGYSDIIYVAGSDRVAQFEQLLNTYNGKDYNFNSINIVSAGQRDPDADGAEGMSASKMKAAAVDNNFDTFKSGVAGDEKLAQMMFGKVRKGMQLENLDELQVKQQKPKLDVLNNIASRTDGKPFPLSWNADSNEISVGGKVYIAPAEANKFLRFYDTRSEDEQELMQKALRSAKTTVNLFKNLGFKYEYEAELRSQSIEETYDGDDFYHTYGDMWFNEDYVDEAEYQGRKVSLGKPMRGDVKKFKVYVRDPKTKNIKKVNFGDPNMKIKKSNPARRRSFRARHNCDNPGPRTKARYWSCRKW